MSDYDALYAEGFVCLWCVEDSTNIVQKIFDLHFSPADTVGLVPMNFSSHDLSIRQSHYCETFHLSPLVASVLPVQLGQTTAVPNRRSPGDSFYPFYIADDFRIDHFQP